MNFTEDQLRRAMLMCFRNGAVCYQANLCDIKPDDKGNNIIHLSNYVNEVMETGFTNIIEKLKKENGE